MTPTATVSADPSPLSPALRRLALVAVALALTACASRTPAPVEDRPARPVAPPPPAAAVPAAPKAVAEPAAAPAYTVKRGDTLYAIALDHGLDYRELAAWNNVENVNVIRVGQVLRLAAPGEAAAAAAPAGPGVTTTPLRAAPPVVAADARPAPSAPAMPVAVPGPRNADNYKSSPKALKEPFSEQGLRDMQRAASSAPPPAPEPAPPVVARTEPAPVTAAPAPAPRVEPKPAAPAGDDDRLEWAWPAAGKLVTGFSENPNLKGIDIAGAAGQPVMASAAGKVVYVGTGIRGYGKLIIVKHNATYLTAYAHNREILVKEGQQVTKGQKIAEMGNTDADQVKLHFEIRKQGTPVDPLRYLPPA